MNGKIEQVKAVDTFKDLLGTGLEKIKEACAFYVSVIDSSDDNGSSFRRECKFVPPSAWAGFEMVGRDALDHRLLWFGGHARRFISGLPKSEQKNVLDNGFKVAVNENDIIVISAEELSKDDTKKVFSSIGCMRDATKQRAWMKRQSLKAIERKEIQDVPYYITKNKLVVTSPMKIDLSKLRRMLK